MTDYCVILDTVLNQESPLILEGATTYDSHSQKDVVTSLRLRSICEGNPKSRLQRLLKRHKFDEAEAFAKINRLDPEEVTLARAEMMLTSLSPFRQGQDAGTNQSTPEQLFKLVRGIKKHPESVVRLCENAVLPTVSDISKLLSIAYDVVKASTSNTSSPDAMEWLTSLNLERQRLNTFQLLSAIKKNCRVSSGKEEEAGLVTNSILFC